MDARPTGAGPFAQPSSTRPSDSDWVFATPDGNVLLSGRLLSEKLEDGAQFELAPVDGIYIEHPSLVTISTSSRFQTLRSLNTGTPILTVPLPLHPSPSPSRQPPDEIDAQALSPSSTSNDAVIVTLHPPFLSPASLFTLRNESPLWSSTFNILLDGPSFPPPAFDPASLNLPGTPSVGPSGSDALFAATSPSTQRQLITSPLLSPQRRASSQASDASVPPLHLGLSRGRATSVTRSSVANRQGAGGILQSLLPTSQHHSSGGGEPSTSKLTLTAIASNDISKKSRESVEEIIALRKAHDNYVKRVKLELEVLETRSQASFASVNGNWIIKGFGNTSVGGLRPSPSSDRNGGRSLSPAAARGTSVSRSRDRSVERAGVGTTGTNKREVSLERSPLGISNTFGSDVTFEDRNGKGRTAGPQRDEETSEAIRRRDVVEDEERGRSRSRAGRNDEGRSKSASSRGRKPTSAVISEKSSPQATRTSTTTPAIGMEIPATTSENGDDDDDDDDESVEEEKAADEDEQKSKRPYIMSRTEHTSSALSPPAEETMTQLLSPTTAPPTHALVSIPESEELSLPPSETSGRTPSARSPMEPRIELGNGEDDEEHETPFEMDEDIDTDHAIQDQTDLAAASGMTGQANDVSNAGFGSPSRFHPASPPNMNTSYRGGSMRNASVLSSSYAALLSQSSLRNGTLPSVSSAPQTTNSSAPGQVRNPFDLEGMPTTSPRDAVTPRSPPGTVQGTQTSALEDVQSQLAFVPPPDPMASKAGERKIREVLAVDAPSHRAPLPRRRKPSTTAPEEEDDEAEEVEDDDYTSSHAENSGNSGSDFRKSSTNFAVGSLPIAIGSGPLTGRRKSTSAHTRTVAERELQRKTSVPGGREGLYVPPLHPNRRVVSAGNGNQRAVGFEVSAKGGGTGRGVALDSLTKPIPEGIPMSSFNSSRSTAPATVDTMSHGPSSFLATSLRNPPPSFARAVESEVDSTRDRSLEDGDGESDEESDKPFVPPHVWTRSGRADEELLSRSVTDY